jgi:ferredoxin
VIGLLFEKFTAASELRTQSRLCCRVRHPRSKCRACEDVCPSNSVSVIDGIVSVLRTCSGCEACIPACPSGVFTRVGKKERQRREQLKRSLQYDATARFSCSMQKSPEAEASVVFPCLGGLPVAYLIAPLAWGGKTVQVKRGECDRCALRAAMSQFDQSLTQARQLLACFGIPAERLEEVERFDPVPSDGSDQQRLSERPLGRREFFRIARKRSWEKTLSLIPAPKENLGEKRWVRQPNPLRGFLLELLPGLGAVRDGVLSTRGFPVASLEVADSCVGCNVCETICPTSALRREVPNGEEIRLMFDPSRCVGCGICRQACLPKAISFRESIDLRELLHGEETELIRVSARNCRSCGQPFQGLIGDTCPECFGSLRRGVC